MSETHATDEPKRKASYLKEPARENKLRALNVLLAPFEKKLTARFTQPRRPVVFLVGAPRCGSTLLSRLLAHTDRLAYVSNFVARFWRAPYLGARIEQALGIRSADREASHGLPDEPGYRFHFGVTEGWAGPHEFGYFWSRWFPFGKTHKLDADQIATVDRAGLLRSVASLEEVYQKPMFFKFLANTLQIEFLSELFPHSLFVICRRSPLYNAQSLALSRDELFGDRTAWFSTRPGDYHHLRRLEWHQQVVGQLASIQTDMEKGLQRVPPNRKLDVSYHNVCEHPRREVATILNLVCRLAAGSTKEAETAKNQVTAFDLAHLPESFNPTDTSRLPPEEFSLLEKTCRRHFGAADTEAQPARDKQTETKTP